MESEENRALPEIVALTADIVAAYVSNNTVTSADLPALITAVNGALNNLGQPKLPEPEKLEPAVPIKRSVTPDFLISLEDGRRYKTLKRHLAGRGLTPDEYRQKWSLPRDYPMVAPNYAQTRSELAKKAGLGQQRGKPSATLEAAAEGGAAGDAKPKRARKAPTKA